MIAVKIGSTSWRRVERLEAGEVEYTGPVSMSLIWGDDVQNLREPTAVEALAIAALKSRASIPPVSRRQMFTALHRLRLLQTLKQEVASANDPELRIALDESTDFRRDDTFVEYMTRVLAKSDAEMDEIFQLAASVLRSQPPRPRPASASAPQSWIRQSLAWINSTLFGKS